MALVELTKIDGSGINTQSNIHSHNIQSTGIITAVGLNVSGPVSIAGTLTYDDVKNVDSIGIITARTQLNVGSNIKLGAAGIITATNFVKADGGSLGGGLTAESNTPRNTHSNNAASALTSNSTNNVLIGWNAGNNISTGDDNVIMGYRAGGVHNNSKETIIGANCFSEKSDHTNAVGLGYGAGMWNRGDNNTAIGYESVGAQGNSAGNNNTGLGYQALRQITDGSNNVALGYQANYPHTTGSNCIVIGANADASSVSVSNEITLGDANITKLRIPGLNSFEISDAGVLSGTASAATSASGFRNVTVSTASPSGGSDGDVWIKYS